LRADFVHGIRFRLVMAALALLALPWLAAQFISRMEAFLRDSQEQAIGGTARTVAAALSDRPALFRAAAGEGEREAEERRRIVALFASADPDAAAGLGNAYGSSMRPRGCAGCPARCAIRRRSGARSRAG
jgi:hypothetical protein